MDDRRASVVRLWERLADLRPADPGRPPDDSPGRGLMDDRRASVVRLWERLAERRTGKAREQALTNAAIVRATVGSGRW